jgi:predicted amidophosphoribosyltransferase
MAETRFCPVCFAEYVSGTLLCEDCGIELVDETEVPENDPPIEEGLVRIWQINGFLRSQLIRQYLAANRIPCSTTRSMFGDAIGCDLYVFESDALRAKRLIHQYLTDCEESAV